MKITEKENETAEKFASQENVHAQLFVQKKDVYVVPLRCA